MNQTTFNGASHFNMRYTPIIKGYTRLTPRQIREAASLAAFKARLTLWSVIFAATTIATITQATA